MLLEVGECKLVSEPKGQSCMLQHMIETEVFNLVLRGMNLVVRVLEVGFDDESRWITSL